MASFAALSEDVMSWLNRRDIEPRIPGLVRLVETEIAETCRTKYQLARARQLIDSAYITLPPNFTTMESIRDYTSGEMFELKDVWSGHWGDPPDYVGGPCMAYRVLGDCIEFLPHPMIPDPPDPAWRPQEVLMGWFAKPVSGDAFMPALINSADTNPILENLYGIYLFGIIKFGAIFELDDARIQQADAQFQQVVTRANLWTQQSAYSGAPLRAELVEF